MTLFYYLFVLALFLLITGYRLFAEGMFVDGVTYACISRNLAEGLGSFWDPHFTATLFPHFHEHPPLAIGLEGMAFRIFGDSLLVERLYSLSAFLITGYIMVLIWKELTGDKKSGWIPLLLWMFFPMISWAAPSNLLDNTLGIFTTLAIWLALKNHSGRNPFFLVMAGFSLFCGLLVKGPFALFPWVIPFLWEFSRPHFSLKKAVSGTLILVFSTLLPLVLLVLLSMPARENLEAYWLNQVVASIESVRTVSSRFYILGILLSEMILPVLIVAAAFRIFRKHLAAGEITKKRRTMILLAILGLCGVLPIMISLKQSSFYLLSALPVFALMLALPLHAIIREPLSGIGSNRAKIRIFRFAVLMILAISLIVPPYLAGKNPRDRQELEMIHDFSTVIPPGSTIRIPSALFTDWSLHSYFMRHSHISLDPSGNPAASFYLTTEIDWKGDPAVAHLTPFRQKNGFALFRK